jgi:hypothetical protein
MDNRTNGKTSVLQHPFKYSVSYTNYNIIPISRGGIMKQKIVHSRIKAFEPGTQVAFPGKGNLETIFGTPKSPVKAVPNGSWPVPKHNPDEHLKWQDRHLFEAAGSGKVDAARDAIAKGANVNARTETWEDTPLMHAAFNGSAATVRLLLAHGADPYAVNSSGRSVLDTAVGAKKWRAVKVLKDHMAKQSQAKVNE